MRRIETYHGYGVCLQRPSAADVREQLVRDDGYDGGDDASGPESGC